jgi:hypothetical protein
MIGRQTEPLSRLSYFRLYESLNALAIKVNKIIQASEIVFSLHRNQNEDFTVY